MTSTLAAGLVLGGLLAPVTALAAPTNRPPLTPVFATTAGRPCGSNSPGPVLTSTAASPISLGVWAFDLDAGQSLDVTFSLTRSGSTTTVSTGPRTRGHAVVQLPADLPAGSYTWTARSSDGLGQSPSSRACSFSVVGSATSTAPTQPAVTTDAPDPARVGTGVHVSFRPGSKRDRVAGYAWTWQSSAGAPTYSALPSCSGDTAEGGVHFVCGSGVSLTVAPETVPQASLRVWAFDAAGRRSPVQTVTLSTVGNGMVAPYPDAHQWTTDLVGYAGPGTPCDADGALSCVPDTAGAAALQLPVGVVWTDGGNTAAGGPAGVLEFATADAPARSALVVDPSRSFTVGGWLTPGAASAAQTAISSSNAAGAGFALQRTAAGAWAFGVRTGTSSATAVAAGGAVDGQPVYVAGVYDAVNREVRLYLNGTLAAVRGGSLAGSTPLDQGVLVGAGWTGQIANPVVLQAAMTTAELAQLRSESFFDLGLG